MLPVPNLSDAFRYRVSRLTEALTLALSADADCVLCLPPPTDERYPMWRRQVEEERSSRPHLLPTVSALPEDFSPPAPWTIGTALALAREGVERVAEEMVAEVQFCVENFVDPKYQAAVFARPGLVQQWPRPRRETHAAAWALHALTAVVRDLPKLEQSDSTLLPDLSEDEKALVSYYWPGEVAPLTIATWAAPAALRIGISNNLVEEAKIKVFSDIFLQREGRRFRVPAAGLAVCYLLEQTIFEESKRPAIAVDAGKNHHGLLSGMRDWPKDGKRHRGKPIPNPKSTVEADGVYRVELFEPGKPVQLQLEIGTLQAMPGHAIEALRRLRGAKGLRHWAALMRLFSVEGGRSGFYRWLISEHLEAMGYGPDARRDPQVRAEAAREVEALAALELAIYSSNGTLRERKRLLLETGRFERLEGSDYKLEGIEFQINPRLFEGVRSPSGALGTKWMPAPIELAQIDHIRYPYAHSLGMLLAIRFRWRLDEQGDVLRLSGTNLLQLAGIIYQADRPSRSWEKLKNNLDILQKVEQIERYEWDEYPWTLDGVCAIYPAAWTLDRAARGVIPMEKPVDRDRPVTGKDLKAWRERKGLSQREAAEQLSVSQPAIAKAEREPEEALGPKLRSAFMVQTQER